MIKQDFACFFLLYFFKMKFERILLKELKVKQFYSRRPS